MKISNGSEKLFSAYALEQERKLISGCIRRGAAVAVMSKTGAQ